MNNIEKHSVGYFSGCYRSGGYRFPSYNSVGGILQYADVTAVRDCLLISAPEELGEEKHVTMYGGSKGLLVQGTEQDYLIEWFCFPLKDGAIRKLDFSNGETSFETFKNGEWVDYPYSYVSTDFTVDERIATALDLKSNSEMEEIAFELVKLFCYDTI